MQRKYVGLNFSKGAHNFVFLTANAHKFNYFIYCFTYLADTFIKSDIQIGMRGRPVPAVIWSYSRGLTPGPSGEITLLIAGSELPTFQSGAPNATLQSHTP